MGAPPAVAELHMAVSWSVISLDMPAVDLAPSGPPPPDPDPAAAAAAALSRAYLAAKAGSTPQHWTRNLSLEWSRADWPSRSYEWSRICLSRSTSRIDTFSVLLGATTPWLGRTRYLRGWVVLT